MMEKTLRNLIERVGELERRLEHMVVRGKIHQVDTEKSLAVVNFGTGENQQLTSWLPWKPIRTGNSTVWWTPDVGEGVTIISNGDLALGEIFLGSYHNDMPAPSNDPNLFLIEFSDGSLISHNKASGEFNLMTTGNINIASQENLNISIQGDAGVTCEGDINATAQGNIIADATQIKLNGGAGCITGESICHFNGLPHADMSTQVFAGK